MHAGVVRYPERAFDREVKIEKFGAPRWCGGEVNSTP